MKKFNAILSQLLMMVLMMLSSQVFAIPAKPTPLTLSQPDGTKLTVRLRGDEFHHFYTTTDGYLIQQDGAGYFYYSTLNSDNSIALSNVRVSNVDQRTSTEKEFVQSINQNATFSALETQATQSLSKLKFKVQKSSKVVKKFPTTGTVRSLVILVQYQDVKFTTSDPYTAFNNLLNQQGYSYNGGTGSVRDYFIDNSSGNFKPQYDVLGPVTLANNMSYYGGNDASGNDKAPEQMVIEACKQLDATVDFSQYDTDGDGWVDNIYVFYAGKGEADGGSTDTVWPHAWNVYEGAGVTLILDGKQIGSYSCSNEIEGSTSKLTGIGTFTHEFCHVLGLPDLYATSYTSSFTPGEWSILDYGPYNNSGNTPPYMTVYERYSLGWLTPTELTSAKSVTLKNISQNEGYIIKTDKDNEYFLLENRQQIGSDVYIPGHGMLIWHIDYNQTAWNNNVVNNTPTHQYVDIEEADGTQTEASRAGDAFPGTANKTAFTDATTPSMKTWAGVSLSKPVSNITESNGIISFDFKGGDSFQSTPVATSATNVTPGSFTANWQAYAGADRYELDVYQLDASSQKQYVSVYQAKSLGNVVSAEVTGLQPSTKYYFVVRGATQYVVSSNSNEISLTTADPTFDYLAPVALTAKDTTSATFTATWQAMTDATGYFLNVYKKANSGTSVAANITFTNNLTDLPTGWSTTSSNFYTTSGYYGQAAPALKMDKSAQYIQSQIYSNELASLSFWYRGASTSPSSYLTVQGYNGTTWTDLKVIKPLSTSSGQTVTLAASDLKGIYGIKWIYSKASGNLALDDIVVTTSGATSIVPLADYTNKDVQNVLLYNVTGLDKETEYYYTVSATNGTLTSKVSNEIKVTTKSSTSGIQTLSSDCQINVLSGEIVINSTSSTVEQVLIYNLAGQKVYSNKLNGTLSISTKELPRGVYFIKVGRNAKKFTL